MRMLQEELLNLLEPTIQGLGFDLWGLLLISGGKRQTLRLFIDSSRGINVDDCASVSRQVGAVLDVEDALLDDYVLEVSSPGLDRYLFKLAHYKMFVGAQLKLRLKISYSGRKNFIGRLMGIENGDEIVLQVDHEEYVLPFENIERAQVVA